MFYLACNIQIADLKALNFWSEIFVLFIYLNGAYKMLVDFEVYAATNLMKTNFSFKEGEPLYPGSSRKNWRLELNS